MRTLIAQNTDGKAQYRVNVINALGKSLRRKTMKSEDYIKNHYDENGNRIYDPRYVEWLIECKKQLLIILNLYNL